MAKFILEVSDEYIRNHADPERMAASIGDKTIGKDALSALFDVIMFKCVWDEIDKGTTEFNVSIDDMDNDGERGIFITHRVALRHAVRDEACERGEEAGRRQAGVTQRRP